MTDELKNQLRQLVADPPPPTGVPSEVLFERVRTVRRRRTAGAAAALATAAVAAVALTSGTLAGPDSAPPVINTPSEPATIVTSPPTVTPTPKPSSPPAKSPVNTADTRPPKSPSSPVHTAHIPPPTDASSPSDTSPSGLQPVRVTVRLTPTIDGLTVRMRFRESGTMLRPVIERTGKSVAAPTWRDNAYMTGYTWGDGTPGAGANAGLLTCKGAYQRVTGSGTDTARDPHTYAAPGTYTFTYTFWYCGPDGVQKTTKTMRLTVG